MQCWRYSSISATDAPAPPLLLKLRADLKNAMRSKDTARYVCRQGLMVIGSRLNNYSLNVLRGVLVDVTNASKTSNPIKTDLQLASILRRKSTASKAAAEEFASAKREDMTAKEMEQVEILNGYASSVETLSEEEMRAAITSLVAEVRKDGKSVNLGSIIKALVGPGGSLAGKPVDNAALARIAKEMLQ